MIIGSGIGGATVAAGLAPSGARSRSSRPVSDCRTAGKPRSARDLPARVLPAERGAAYDAAGAPFNPGNYYNVGGTRSSTALYWYGSGARILRQWNIVAASRRPGRLPMTNWNRGTVARSNCYEVRGELGDDPTGRRTRGSIAFAPVPDEAPIAAVRAKLKRAGTASGIVAVGCRYREVARRRRRRRGMRIPTATTGSRTRRRWRWRRR